MASKVTTKRRNAGKHTYVRWDAEGAGVRIAKKTFRGCKDTTRTSRTTPRINIINSIVYHGGAGYW